MFNIKKHKCLCNWFLLYFGPIWRFRVKTEKGRFFGKTKIFQYKNLPTHSEISFTLMLINLITSSLLNYLGVFLANGFFF